MQYNAKHPELIKPRLILASTSQYRQQMLSRLHLPFEVVAPAVSEAALLGETPWALAGRLAREKARAVALQNADAIVIGADQVLNLNGQALGKPGSLAAAGQQLGHLSGQTVVFHSAIAVLSPTASWVSVIDSHARFRTLSKAQIDYYVQIDQPTDTAGSAKAEKLGIALLEQLNSTDPTAIIGLPLIELTRLLTLCGLDPLDQGS
jgi:septum formation protein